MAVEGTIETNCINWKHLYSQEFLERNPIPLLFNSSIPKFYKCSPRPNLTPWRFHNAMLLVPAPFVCRDEAQYSLVTGLVISVMPTPPPPLRLSGHLLFMVYWGNLPLYLPFYFWSSNMWVFPKQSNSLTLLECPTLQFHSDTICLELKRPHRLRSQSHKTALLPSDVRCKSRLLPVSLTG